MNASIACRATPLKSKHILGLFILFLAIAVSVGVASASPAIKVLQGADQLTSYGSGFPNALVVWVTDSVTQRAMSGLRVNFTPGAGIELSSSYATTDDYGLAFVTATGVAPCFSGVSVEVVGFDDVKAVFEGLIVEKATLTVVPTDLNAQLGGGIPAATTYTIQGFVNGDTEDTAQITGAPVLTTTANDRSPHANYAIKGGVGSLSAPNYTFVAGFGTLAILEGSKSGSPQDQLLEASMLIQPATDDKTNVRPALLNQITATTVSLPAFLAGIRDESGASVQTAISPDFPIASTTAPSTYVGSEIRELPLAMATIQPAFVAGLRGESGVFVRAAIWPNHAVAPASTPSSYIGSSISQLPLAIPIIQQTFLAGVRENSDVPVRAAIATTLDIASAIAKTPDASDMQFALPVVLPDVQQTSEVPVRTAISSILMTVSTTPQSSYSQSAIRKALNPPGTE